ncbi:sensor domain-containing diguanylate cyclase [Paenibacillus brasilensis]|uniref:Diguanylate cyclase (GGDEF)-like protein n=1 Tax=Paenibacillus brasilensis TaxID=128574 RepID=A0ABU0KS08_9BACL|nr:GGDEF domain-containing protein [Paenibacillus brasilensis]MDQ0492212.1 diguanylate cyclase (GGDEF)-like protein [Paenibacillus brasilensis]
MSEFSTTDQQTLDGTVQASGAPLFDDKGYTSFAWLQTMDMTPYDFPYINQLLVQGYRSWLQQSDGISWINEQDTAVFNFTGVRLTGREEDDDEDLGLVERCCLSREIEVSQRKLRDGSLGFVYMVPILCRNHQREPFAALRFTRSAQYVFTEQDALLAAALHFRSCFYSKFEYIFMEDILGVQNRSSREGRRRSILFQIVKRLHDKIDVEGVLDEVFDSIAYFFPHVDITLYMSQDRHSRNPQVKPLLLHERDEDICVLAFMKGQMTVNETVGTQNEVTEIGIPLRGKQGVYGVFHMILPSGSDSMKKVDVELIAMMADTAGTAFENAKLLEQSNVLIHELRLINELVQRLNQSLKLNEVFEFAMQELLQMFMADFCCIMQLDQEENYYKVTSSNVESIRLHSYPRDEGFAGLMRKTGEPVIVSDYRKEGKISSKFMDLTNSLSLMAVPMKTSGTPRGVILLSSKRPNFFSYDNYKMLQMLAPHIGLAVTNAMLHAEVRRLANMDMLTGLYVRHYVDQCIQQHQEKDFCGSLILVDIDQFKQVNDTYGHQTGDEILKNVSDIIRSTTRDEDVCARWGGEELAIYLPQLGVQQALQFAEKIRYRVQHETKPRVTVSCGIAEWNWMDEQINMESLFYKADMALYEAKNEGRNRIVCD